MNVIRLRRCARTITRRLADESGFSLPELLVGVAVSALVMGAVTTTIFTTNDLQRRVAERDRFAADIAVAALDLDRDGAMATATAPALSQTSSTSCATTIDLGFLEGGASVRFRTVAAGAPADGPLLLQRLSGAGTRDITHNVSGCSWRTERDVGGDWTLRLDLVLTGPAGETLSQTIRATPRLW
jgi:prepilin-type N-terminal cleavage/methylation domain-containing protein